MSALSISHAASPRTKVKPLDRDLRGYLETNADIVTRITKPVKMEHIGALSAQSDRPILFENISSHAGTIVTGPRSGLPSFVTPHTRIILRKYQDMGKAKMPMAFVFGLHPAYEIISCSSSTRAPDS